MTTVKPSKELFNDGWIKEDMFGKITQNIVENILKRRFEVYNFGYEVITESLAQKRKETINYNETFNTIQAKPDYIIYNAEKGLRYVEVKAKRDKTFKEAFEQNKLYKDATFHKVLRLAKYYPNTIIVNLVWDIEIRNILLYEPVIENEDVVLKELPLGTLFEQVDVDKFYEVMSWVIPPGVKS